jgi:hypothetical protein
MTGMPRRARIALLLALTGAITLLSAAPASAIYHLVKIREVSPETGEPANDAFIELQMYAPGQNSVSAHTIRIYNAAGSNVTQRILMGPDPANGQSQRTILIGDTGVPGRDFTITGLSDGPSGTIPLDNGAGGAVCFDETLVDCVSWGTFNNSGSMAGIPVGSNAAAIPAGQSLTRSISRGCATALDDSDDTDSSSADFFVSARSPRPNSAPPTETPCPGGGGGGGGGRDRNPPETFITRRPANRTFDRTPTYRFRSDEARARFECKIGGFAYRLCSSPFTWRRLDLGLHRVLIRARDRANNRDRTPAKDFFRILERR